MKKQRDYQITEELLIKYQNAALENAQELVDEASLLYSEKHYARSYFLALASIEEVGKSHISFSTRGRNLKDTGMCNKIREHFECHDKKIVNAFVPWMMKASLKREAIEVANQLMLDLKYGREKAMYIDVKSDQTLSIPKQIVRPVAAKDCIRIATNCINYAKYYYQNNKPYKYSSYDDKLMSINTKQLTTMMNNIDFWEYYLDCLKTDKSSDAFNKSMVKYYDGYYKKKIKYKSIKTEEAAV